MSSVTDHEPPGDRKHLGIVLKGYRTLALWFFTLVLLLIIVNLALYFLCAPDAMTAASIYGINRVMAAYPGWTRNDVLQLLDEFTGEYRSYDVIRQLTLRPRKSRFVNIDAAGFRHVEDQAPWPPDRRAVNIFVFGGSTTFGFGVPDSATIPSDLQRVLGASCANKQIHVYNFGVPAYTSTQELLTFISVLRDGFVPNIAIFIDGLNDSMAWKGSWGPGDLISARISHPLASALVDLPMIALARRAARLLLNKAPPNEIGTNDPGTVADELVRRWNSNRRLIEQIAATRQIKTLFVWQPVCMYKYDLKYHFLSRAWAARRQFALETPVQFIYPRIERLSAEGALGSNFLYLGDIQANVKENLYVDVHHYNPQLCIAVADRIGGFIKSQAIINNCAKP